MTPTRIQRKRTKGYRLPPNTIYCGRPSKWGNPYTGPRAVEMFRAMMQGRWTDLEHLLIGQSPDGSAMAVVLTVCSSQITRKRLMDDLHELTQAKHLACWCPPDKPCHVDVLIEMLNRSKP